MEKLVQTDQRRTAWAVIAVFVAILVWNLGYFAAKFANGVPIEPGVPEAIILGDLLVLAGFVLRYRRWL
jgi:hypothetical protein